MWAPDFYGGTFAEPFHGSVTFNVHPGPQKPLAIKIAAGSSQTLTLNLRNPGVATMYGTLSGELDTTAWTQLPAVTGVITPGGGPQVVAAANVTPDDRGVLSGLAWSNPNVLLDMALYSNWYLEASALGQPGPHGQGGQVSVGAVGRLATGPWEASIAFGNANNKATTQYAFQTFVYGPPAWSWVGTGNTTLPALGSGTISTLISVPAGTPAAKYSGQLIFSTSDGDFVDRLPLSITVLPSGK